MGRQSDSFERARAACEAGDADQLARVVAEEPTVSVRDALDAAAGTVRAALLLDGVRAEDVSQLQLDEALVMAAGATRLRAVDELIERGARISGRDRWGRTALHLACNSDGLEFVTALVERGASAGQASSEMRGSFGRCLSRRSPSKRVMDCFWHASRGIPRSP